VEKVAKKCGPKANNHSLSKNSSNLVTLPPKDLSSFAVETKFKLSPLLMMSNAEH
jgi:hypothetical protein